MSDKLTPKSDKYIFVWYLRETKGYYFYNKAKGKVFVGHNGVFLEKEFLSKKELVGVRCRLEEIRERPKNVTTPTDPIHEVLDVVPLDVEELASHRSIRAHCTTEKFTFLTTK
jgi:hypothetical protein